MKFIVKRRVRQGREEFTTIPDNGSRPVWTKPGQPGWFATRQDAQRAADQRNAYEGRG